MKGLVFVLAVCLAAMVPGVSYATIDIDISNSQIEIVDAHSIKLRNVIAHGYPGTYWVEFRWDPNSLVFAPVNGGPETTSVGRSWTVTNSNSAWGSVEITIRFDPSNRIIRLSFKGLSPPTYSTLPPGLVFVGFSVVFYQGSRYFGAVPLPESYGCSIASSTMASFFGYDGWNPATEVYLGVGETKSGEIRCIPSWFDFSSPFIFEYAYQYYNLQ